MYAANALVTIFIAKQWLLSVTAFLSNLSLLGNSGDLYPVCLGFFHVQIFCVLLILLWYFPKLLTYHEKFYHFVESFHGMGHYF